MYSRTTSPLAICGVNPESWIRGYLSEINARFFLSTPMPVCQDAK